MFDAMDVGLITFVLAVLAGDWHLRTDQIGLIGSTGLLGMFVGALISGRVADQWGRKTVFQTTLLVFSVATFLTALAWNVWSMVIFRFVVGIGLGGELPVVATLLTEFIPSKSRARYVVLLESFWALGWLAAATIAYFLIPTYGWRIGLAVGAAPALYIWVVRRKLPESPRWYESKGRNEDAQRVMRQLEEESTRLTGQALQNVQAIEGEQPRRDTQFGFAELWTANYRRSTIMLWILWFGLMFGYYGIFVWLPTLLVRDGYSIVKSFGYVLIMTIAQIPGYFSAAYLVERVGRKIVIVLYLLLSAGAAYLFGHASTSTQILLWGCLMSCFNLGAWGAVYAYTPEIYPTRIRATGAGSAAAFGRIGGFLAPITVGLLLPSIGTKGVLGLNAALLVMSALSVGLMGIETKGKPLPDD
jgi:putative MFS transporter